MKELALLIPSIQGLKFIDEYKVYRYNEINHFTIWMNEELKRIQDQIKNLKLTRIYYGNEFCQRLIPSVQDVKQVLNICEEKQLRFTLVTPYCNDEGLQKVKEIIDEYQKNPYFDEVVINDWGILNYVNNTYKIKKVLGRVMDKMKRDPRFGQRDYKRIFNEEGLKMLQSPSVSAKAYRDLLKEYGVNRAEIDNVEQGLYLDDINNIDLSVYVPYGYITSGRICQFAGIHNVKEEKFTVETKCKKECKSLIQFMHKNVSPMPVEQLEEGELGKIQIMRKGNTIFYLNNRIKNVLENKKINRVIYQPVLPM